jgi:hypothetical protein
MTVQTRPVSAGSKIATMTCFVLVAVAFTAVPTFFTALEFVYSRFGKSADATVTHRASGWQSGGRYGPSRPVLNIEYSFKDEAGLPQTGRDVLRSGADAQLGQSIKIEYVPGSRGMSRTLGNGSQLGILWLVCVFPAMLVLGMVWIAWKVQPTGGTLTKAIAVEHNVPPSGEWSATDRRHWLIAWVVGVVIIAVSLVFDRGVIGVLATIIVPFILAMLYLSDQQTKAAQKRIRALWSLAQELTWEFAADGNEKLHQGLSRFHLSTLGQTSILTNLMYGRCDGTDVAVFEYQWIRGKQQSTQTVAWMQRRGERMTEFSLRPESVWNQLGGWTAHGDINFDSHPDFSRSYLLRGDDEDAIRELFTDNVLTFYERHPNLITEGSGNKLLFYRDGVVVNPENLRSFLDEALKVRALFQPPSQV